MSKLSRLLSLVGLAGGSLVVACLASSSAEDPRPTPTPAAAPAPVDGGNNTPDAPVADGAVDAGPERILPAPAFGATGGPIGCVDGELFWVWHLNGQSAVMKGTPDGTDATLFEPHGAPGSPIVAFDVAYALTFQRADGTLVDYRLTKDSPAGNLYPHVLSTKTPTNTVAVSSGRGGMSSKYDNWTVFYRTADGQLGATSQTNNAPNQLLGNGLPVGDDLVVGTGGNNPTTFGGANLLLSGRLDDAGAIFSTYTNDDGGLAPPTQVITGLNDPRHLRTYSETIGDTGSSMRINYAVWIDGNAVRRADLASPTVITTVFESGEAIKAFAFGSQYEADRKLFIATSTSIHRVSLKTNLAETIRTGLSNVGGIAVCETQNPRVFWTNGDGSVVSLPSL